MATGEWDHELVVDETVARRVSDAQLRQQRAGMAVLAVLLLAVAGGLALAVFESPVLGVVSAAVVVGIALAGQRRQVRASAVRELPAGLVLRSRFDDEGFDLDRSDGFAGRTPWAGLTSIEHVPAGGLVAWRTAGDVRFVVPEEIFPAERVEQARRLMR